MANNSFSVNQIVSIFRDLSIRHEMVNDFGYGPSYNIGASKPMNFPYIWLEQGQAQVIKSLNGYKENIYTFQVYCMDKINKGDDNYDEIISDTKFILDAIISDMSQHKYYIDFNISLYQDIVMDVVTEATDDNVNGWMATISLKNPVRYTPCNVPIEPISGYVTTLNSSITEYRLIGATGPQGPTGPAGPTGPTGPAGVTGSDASLIMAYKKYNVIPDINTFSRVSFLPLQAPRTTGGIATTKFYAIIIQKEVTIDAVWHRVNLGGVGRTLTIALYTNYQTYIPRPDNLIFQIPTDFDMSVTGPQEVTLASPVTLQPGIYWVGFSTNGGALNTFINPGYNHWSILGYQDINGNSGAVLANQTVLFDSSNPYPAVWNLFLSQSPTDGGAVPVIYFKLI